MTNPVRVPRQFSQEASSVCKSDPADGALGLRRRASRSAARSALEAQKKAERKQTHAGLSTFRTSRALMTMDINQLEYLKIKQQQALQSCRENIEKWQKLKSELVAVRDQLSKLPEKMRHEIMVPIGSSSGQEMHFAFMPGYIHHSNEILVLLGDNWFGERSAKQASEVAERRLNKCQAMLDDLNKERTQYEQWLAYVDKVKNEGSEEGIELVEPYDEETEKQWREDHRRKVRESKQQEARERASEVDRADGTHEVLMDRLDRLELENEGTTAAERDDSRPPAPAATERKSVRFRPEEATSPGSTLGQFPLAHVVSQEDSSSAKPTWTSSAAVQAFTGEVLEKQVMAPAEATSSMDASEEPQEPKKRASKFKMSRM